MRMRKVTIKLAIMYEKERKNGGRTDRSWERWRKRYLLFKPKEVRRRLTGNVFDSIPRCSKLDSLLMLKFPPSSIWGTKSELVSIKLELDMRIIQNSLSQRRHNFRCTWSGWKRRCQGQRHLRCMGWWQSAVQRNSEREDRITLRYYWKNKFRS